MKFYSKKYIDILIKRILILFLLFAVFQTNAQNTDRAKNKDGAKNKEGFFFGVTLGAMFPNNRDAAFYGGDPSKIFTLDRLLTTNYDSYYTVYEYLASEVIFDDFTIIEYATQNMKYKPAFAIGGFLGYNFTNRLGFITELNYSNLKASGAFVIERENQLTKQNEQTELGSIHATESRYNIDIGLHYNLTTNKKLNPYLEMGLNFNVVEVKKMK
ncbi:MAG: outer membrane beta-barrel protein [Bacteroidales bacterium]|nr:outer membrane beta-barrel protein [Bacteroidales bacterium]